MQEKPSYFTIMPASIRYNKNLSNGAKILYGEIVALSQKSGYCIAANSYFAKLYDTTTRSVSTWIKNLIDNGYIRVQYNEEETGYSRRYLYVDPIEENFKGVGKKPHTPMKETSEQVGKKFPDPIEENFQHNNTRGNNTSNNKESIKEKVTTSNTKFVPPTVDEVREYVNEKGYHFDPEAFVAWYENKDWKVGDSKMKSWRLACVTWESRRKERGSGRNKIDKKGEGAIANF